MKATSIVLLTSLLMLSAMPVRAVMLGDSRELVLAELGSPGGYVGMQGREVLMYERGEVILEEGVVTSAELISEEEAVARRLRREAEEAERLERERVRRERLALEGEGIRLRKMADADFMNGSAVKRLAFWQQFRRTYPMVELGDEYGAALRERELELAAENAAAASQARIRALEARVAQAEAEAYYGGGPTYVSAASPVVYGGSYVRRSRRPVYVGGRVGGCGLGHKYCRPSCGTRAKVTHVDSSAGYAFQRFRKSSSRGVKVRAGLSSCDTGPRVTPFRSTAGYATQRALPIASRPWRASGGSVVHRPISRGGLSASACISF